MNVNDQLRALAKQQGRSNYVGFIPITEAGRRMQEELEQAKKDLARALWLLRKARRFITKYRGRDWDWALLLDEVDPFLAKFNEAA